MRVAVIGAGVVGVTTAHELAVDGHAVTVFERRGSVAEENSFAHGGLLSIGGITPGGWIDGGRLGRSTAQRLAGWWRSRRGGGGADGQAHPARMVRLAAYSRERLARLTDALGLEHEQSRGVLLLLPTPRTQAQARPALHALAEWGVAMHWLDAEGARAVEPGLNRVPMLHAALHLPDDGVANCRQFSHLLRAQGQRLGVVFRFNRQVLALDRTAPTALRHQPADGARDAQIEAFDAVVVCAAVDAAALLRPLGLELPLKALHGLSITAPLRLIESHPELGPQSAVVDLRHRVTVTRHGLRVRVSGGAMPRADAAGGEKSAIALLYQVLNTWFPGCARLGAGQAEPQLWRGLRTMLPDGRPVIGPGGPPGVWLNLGHGGHGWTLACGAARLLADQLAGHATELDVDGFDVERLQARPLRQ